MTLFSISCTTCRARIAVRNESAIGQILGCPKCGSMVQITPPPGWQPGMVLEPHLTPAPTAAVAPSTAPVEADAESGANWLPWALVSIAVLVVGGLFWAALFSGHDAAPVADVQVTSAATPASVVEAKPEQVAVEPEPPVAPEPTVEAKPEEPSVAAPPETPAPPPPVVEAKPVPPQVTPTTEKTEPAPIAVEPVPTVAAVPQVETPPQEPEPPQPAVEVRPPDSIPQVDAPARLAQAIEAVELRDVSLANVMRFISSASGVPISFDLDSLAAAKRSPHDLVTFSAGSTSLADMLTSVLSPLGLRADIRPNQVIVRAASSETGPMTTPSADVVQTLLGKKVSVAYSDPTTLDTVFARLEDESDVLIVLDYDRLATAGRSGASLVTLMVHDVTLGEAFDKLLPPLGLKAQIIDARTLEITAP